MLTKIINLHASWCGPCKSFAPTFINASNNDEFKNIQFERYDIEDEKGTEYVEKYHVQSVPTTLLLDENNEQIIKISGNIPESDFINLIKTNL